MDWIRIPYETVFLDFQKGEHKAPSFTKFNPNGRIPAIVDHKNNDFVVWESAAILFYIANKYDTEHKSIPAKFEDEIQVLTWVSFQISGLGPYQGQLNWFKHFHKEQIPSAVERYYNETKRVYGVIEGQLKDKEYINGNYGISDMAFFPWVRGSDFGGIVKESDEFKQEFPNLYARFNRVSERPATVKAWEPYGKH